MTPRICRCSSIMLLNIPYSMLSVNKQDAFLRSEAPSSRVTQKELIVWIIYGYANRHSKSLVMALWHPGHKEITRVKTEGSVVIYRDDPGSCDIDNWNHFVFLPRTTDTLLTCLSSLRLSLWRGCELEMTKDLLCWIAEPYMIQQMSFLVVTLASKKPILLLKV
jgi:hypothetical protein